MVIARTMSRINQGASQEKIVVRLEGVDCEPNTQDAYAKLCQLLQLLGSQPFLVQCGEATAPGEVRITHNGTRWVAEISAIVSKALHEASDPASGSAPPT